MSKKYYVYIYYDPRDGSPIYVGMGKGGRAFVHWKKKANNQFFQNVLDKIRSLGCSPRIEFAAIDLTKDEANALEFELVALYGRRDLGKGTLTNLTDGGDGAKGLKLSDSQRKTRQKNSQAFWDTVDHAEIGRKISQVFASRTLEELAAVSANIKASRTPEVRAKIGAASKERMNRPEVKAKKIAELQTPVAREKRAASMKNTLAAPEKREAKKRITSELWKNPEYRRKISEAQKLGWAKRKAESELNLSGSSHKEN